jgi:hypothetical protein
MRKIFTKFLLIIAFTLFLLITFNFILLYYACVQVAFKMKNAMIALVHTTNLILYTDK